MISQDSLLPTTGHFSKILTTTKTDPLGVRTMVDYLPNFGYFFEKSKIGSTMTTTKTARWALGAISKWGDFTCYKTTIING